MAKAKKKVKKAAKFVPHYRPDYLLALADYLDGLDNQFDLNGWYMLKDDDLYGEEYDEAAEKALRVLGKGPLTHKKLKECGTVACAMGHAPSVPVLAKAGLKLEVYNTTMVPEFEGSTGFDAAVALFGIPDTLSEYLFGPDSYDSDDHKDPKAVAKRIREVVSDPFEWGAANY